MQTSTMTTTSTGEARVPPATTATSKGQRTKREVPSEELLNEMAYRVMTSIDRLMELNRPTNDTDQCLQFSLCENNKYSRSMPGNTKIWLPIWRCVLFPYFHYLYSSKGFYFLLRKTWNKIITQYFHHKTLWKIEIAFYLSFPITVLVIQSIIVNYIIFCRFQDLR